jgi:hypothetical protein
VRIIIDVTLEQELQVLAQLQKMGFVAHSEPDTPSEEEIEQSHIQEISDRRAREAKSPKPTYSLEEIKASYAGRGL